MLKSVIMANNIKLSVAPLSIRASISETKKEVWRFTEAQME
jgi:hypothetical protein